jgi:O-antigen polymerase
MKRDRGIGILHSHKALEITVFVTMILISFAIFSNSLDVLNPFFFSERLLLLISLPFFLIVIEIFSFRNFKKITINLIDLLGVIFIVYLSFHLLLTNPDGLLSNQFLIYPVILILYVNLRLVFSHSESLVFKKYYLFTISFLVLIPIVIGLLEFSGVIHHFNSLFSMTGGMLNQGAFANYLAVSIPFIFAQILFKESNNKIPILSWLALLFAILIVTYSKSRSAWLSTIIGCSYTLIWHPKIQGFFKTLNNNRIRHKILALILVVCLIAPLFFSIYNFKKDSADGRIFIWKICTELIKEKPVFGHGFNQFISVYNDKQINYFENNPDDIRNGWLARDGSYAYNDFLQLTVELGVLGLFICLFLLVLLIKRGNWKSNNSQNTLLIGSRAGIISMIVCGLFSYPFFVVQNLLLFFLFASYISSKSEPLFNIKIQPFSQFSVLTISILLLFSIGGSKVQEYYCCTKRKKAHCYAEEGNIKDAVPIYEEIYPVLKSQSLFLFNYGSQLYNHNQSQKSINLLKSSIALQSSYDSYLNLAIEYEACKDWQNAERIYLKCSNLIPHRFLPKYRLFTIYKNEEDISKTIEMAKKIVNMDIKIYSPLVGNIKNEALNYLSKLD